MQEEIKMDYTTIISEMGIVKITILAFLVLAVKGWALWDSARAQRKAWFVCLLIFNTLGILPAIYLLFFRRKK
jgi:hypothetical protein